MLRFKLPPSTTAVILPGELMKDSLTAPLPPGRFTTPNPPPAPHSLTPHPTHACQFVSQLFHFLSAPKLCRWLSIYSSPVLVRDDRNSRIVDSRQQTFQSTLVFLEKEQCFTGGGGVTVGLSRLNLCTKQSILLTIFNIG